MASAGPSVATPVEKTHEEEITMSRIEAMVTPEQVLSASVARRRRNISKKRSSSVHRSRDLTPARDTIPSTSSEDDARTTAKLPERPRRKVARTASDSYRAKPEKTEANDGVRRKSESELTNNTKNDENKHDEIKSNDINGNTSNIKTVDIAILETELNTRANEIILSDELPPQLANDFDTTNKTSNNKSKKVSESKLQAVKKKLLGENKPKAQVKTDKTRHSSLTRNGSIPRHYDKATAMLKSGVNTITSITQDDVKTLLKKAKRSMTPKTKKEAQQRSQSHPPQFTEAELYESFMRAKLYEENTAPNQHSSGSEQDKNVLLKTEKPKKKRRGVSCEKIIQVLDPKTSKILATRAQSRLKFRFFDFLKILRYLTIRDIILEYRAFKVDMKAELDRIRVLRNRCFSMLFLMMIFCGLGAIMFKTVEGAFENFYKCGVKRVKRDFIDNLWVKSHSMREEDWKMLARSKLRAFEEELHNAHEAGMHSYSGQRSWSFLNGIVYCLTIVTTIGYGHMAPTTTTGRALTIVYAIIGIPLFLIILTDFGKLFTRCIKYLWSYVRRLYYTGSCRRVRKQAHVEDIMKGAQFMYEVATFRRPSMFAAPNEEDLKADEQATTNTNTPTTPAPSNFEIDDEFNLPISLAIFILLLYIFLGSLIYLYWEEWDFFASFYFVFISMSTIGFGDYVPQRPMCMLVSIVYLVFGLALMSMCINVVQAKLSDTFKHASAKIGATIGLTVSDEDGSITTVPPDGVEIPQVHKDSPVDRKGVETTS